jgi:putative transposase
VENSWFSIVKKHHLKKNLQKISCQSSLSFQPESMVSEVTKLRSRKNPIFPTPHQKSIFKEWFGIYRWFYNRTLDHVKEYRIFSFTTLRDSMREKYKYQNFVFPEWYKGPREIPSRIIDGAIKRIADAYTTGFEQLKLGIIKKFSLHYKTKKDRKQSVILFKDVFNKTSNAFSKKYLGTTKSQHSLKSVDCDSVLHYDHVLHTYYLTIPRNVNHSEKQVVKNTLSMDPGKRCFLTGYSPEGHIIEIANGKSHKLEYHFKKIDMINSLYSRTKNKKKKESYRKAKRRRYKRVQNLVDDLHWKTINFLVKNYKSINVGDLSTKQVSQTKINKGVKRVLQMFSFCKFKQRLQESCQAFDRNYKCIDESFTSKTCTLCGDMQAKRKDKVFECSRCHYCTDRDWNGARNIHLKSLSATSINSK